MKPNTDNARLRTELSALQQQVAQLEAEEKQWQAVEREFCSQQQQSKTAADTNTAAAGAAISNADAALIASAKNASLATQFLQSFESLSQQVRALIDVTLGCAVCSYRRICCC